MPHLADAGVEIGAAERQPTVEGVAVAIVGTLGARCERVGGRRELGVGGGDTGPPGEEGVHGFVDAPLGLLGQVPDGRRRWREADGTAIGRDPSSKALQQRRLADTVRPDQTDPAARAEQ